MMRLHVEPVLSIQTYTGSKALIRASNLAWHAACYLAHLCLQVFLRHPQLTLHSHYHYIRIPLCLHLDQYLLLFVDSYTDWGEMKPQNSFNWQFHYG